MIQFAHTLGDRLDRLANPLLPTLARLVFAGVLLLYFWSSALTKLGDGVFGFLFPSAGAYVQVFPKAMEAAGYDVGAMSVLQWAVVVAGTWAELVLPLLVVIGLLTRLASLGMTLFIVVQSAVDITGHGADAATIGQWFDKISDALIVDQRAFWILTLTILVLKGAGPLSVDRILFRNRPS